MPDSEAKKRWDRDNMALIGLKLHKQKDADIIEFLTLQGKNKQTEIKRILKEYIANHPEEK